MLTKLLKICKKNLDPTQTTEIDATNTLAFKKL